MLFPVSKSVVNNEFPLSSSTFYADLKEIAHTSWLVSLKPALNVE